MIVRRSADDGSGDWARGLRPVNRSRSQARLAYDRASGWSRFVEEPFERRARAVGLDLLLVQAGERVLELGCGAGGALVVLARAVGPTGRVVGLDLSPRMIRQAAARLRCAGLSERAELMVADASSIPCADASFDAVFAAFTLELFDTPEIPFVLAECRRVLRPTGRVAVVSLSRAAPLQWPTRLYERLHDCFPVILDCRPIHAGLALEGAGFEHVRSKVIPLWGLRAEAVVAAQPSMGGQPVDDAPDSLQGVSLGTPAGREPDVRVLSLETAP